MMDYLKIYSMKAEEWEEEEWEEWEEALQASLALWQAKLE
jgi:hypothetical protein